MSSTDKDKFDRQFIRIEIVRAISVVYVLIAHLNPVFISVPEWLKLLSDYTHYGVGVIIFFVISGFVVSRSLYLRLHVHSGRPSVKNSKQELKLFYIRRATRLIPLAVIWGVITLTGNYWINRVGYFGSWETNVTAFPSIIFYYANFQAIESWGTLGAFGVYWSLAVEEQFYLIIPLLLIFLSKRATFFILIVALYILMGLWRTQADYIFWRAIWFDGLIMGVLVYLVIGKKIILSKKIHQGMDLLFVIFSTVGFAIIAEFLIKTENLYLSYIPALSCLMFLWALITYEGAVGSGVPLWFEKLCLFIGARSYGLYLSHFAVSMYTREFWHWLGESGHPGWSEGDLINIAMFVSWLVLTFASTEILYRYIERPLTLWGRRYTHS